MNKPVESVIVPESEAEIYSEEEGRFVLNAPSNFYVLISTGDRVYYKTRDRLAAQRQADEDWNCRYTVRVVKDQKTKRRSENGEVTVRGVQTRRGQKR